MSTYLIIKANSGLKAIHKSLLVDNNDTDAKNQRYFYMLIMYETYNYHENKVCK